MATHYSIPSRSNPHVVQSIGMAKPEPKPEVKVKVEVKAAAPVIEVKAETIVGRRPVVVTTDGSFSDLIDRRLVKMGARVVVVRSRADVMAAIDYATHLLLPGGPDIHPAYYNQNVDGALPGSALRDSLEYDLADWALANHVPTLAICRGHQMITVAAGGTLHQDIYRKLGVSHRSMHAAKIIGRRLRAQLGTAVQHLVVNSYHHQAVDRVPQGWFVTARSVDGVIESIGHPRLPVISVQWHPEAMGTPQAIALFRSWLDMKKGNLR